MANDIKISTAARNAACDGIVDLIDAGSGAGKIRIYDGSKPAGPGTAVSTQTKLAELTFSDPAFGAASTGVATASAIASDTAADADGTASWYRVIDSDGNAIIDGTVGTSGCDLNFNTVAIVSGAIVAISSLTYTMPA